MHLTNNFSQYVFWRAFASTDTFYAIGLRDGWLAPGASLDLYDHPSGQFQMEFKSGAAGHPFLKRAGELYRNDDELFVTPEGNVVRLEQALQVERDPGERREIVGTVSNFYDRLAFDADATAEDTTIISTVVTSNGTLATKTTSTSSAETAASGGGEVTGKGTFKGIEAGVKFTGNVSGKLAQTTSQELSSSFGISSVQSTGASRKVSILMRGRTITVIHWVWERFYVTGRARVGGQVYEWEVTTRLEASHRIEQYGSIAAMPPAVFEAYREKYPSTGLSLLRPGTPLLVDGNGWLGLMKITRLDPDGSLEGTIYGQPLRGRWDAALGTLTFVRTIQPTYLQHWELRVNSDSDMRGSFVEEVNGARQPQRFDCRLSARLQVMGNGHAGQMRIEDLASDGSFSGQIYADRVGGRWNQSTGQIIFTRSNGQSTYSQEWVGRRVGELAFAGTFQERFGTNLDARAYNWAAQA